MGRISPVILVGIATVFATKTVLCEKHCDAVLVPSVETQSSSMSHHEAYFYVHAAEDWETIKHSENHKTKDGLDVPGILQNDLDNSSNAQDFQQRVRKTLDNRYGGMDDAQAHSALRTGLTAFEVQSWAKCMENDTGVLIEMRGTATATGLQLMVHTHGGRANWKNGLDLKVQVDNSVITKANGLRVSSDGSEAEEKHQYQEGEFPLFIHADNGNMVRASARFAGTAADSFEMKLPDICTGKKITKRGAETSWTSNMINNGVTVESDKPDQIPIVEYTFDVQPECRYHWITVEYKARIDKDHDPTHVEVYLIGDHDPRWSGDPLKWPMISGVALHSDASTTTFQPWIQRIDEAYVPMGAKQVKVRLRRQNKGTPHTIPEIGLVTLYP